MGKIRETKVAVKVRLPKQLAKELRSRAHMAGYGTTNKMVAAIIENAMRYSEGHNPADADNWVARMVEDEYGNIAENSVNRKDINERL